MITGDQAEKAHNTILEKGPEYAKAKARRVYLEQFRKSKRAMLVRSQRGTVQERQSYAESHAEYVQILEGIEAAVEEEEALRWEIVAAQELIGMWKTQMYGKGM